jgi:hypothetical protein
LVCIAPWNLWVTPGTSGWETTFQLSLRKSKKLKTEHQKNFKIIKEI